MKMEWQEYNNRASDHWQRWWTSAVCYTRRRRSKTREEAQRNLYNGWLRGEYPMTCTICCKNSILVDTLNGEQCSGIHFSRLSHDVSTTIFSSFAEAGCVSLGNWIAFMYTTHGRAYKIARSLRLMAPAISSMFMLAKSDYPCVTVATYITPCCRRHFLFHFSFVWLYECESR